MRPVAAAVYIKNNLEGRKHYNTSTAAADWKSWFIGSDRVSKVLAFWSSRKNVVRVKCIANISWRGKNEQPKIYLKDRGSERRSADYRQQRNRITRKWSQIDTLSVSLLDVKQTRVISPRVCSFRSRRLTRSRDCESFTFDYLFFFFERGGFAIEFSILSVKLVPYFSEVFSRKSCCETNVTLKKCQQTLIFSF